MWLTRSLGIALHPTSLPGGRLGREAFAFVDWLAAAGARWWQVLPLNPPDEHGSPYASASAFAAWPGLLADPDAGVAPSEVRAFEQRHRYWISDWADYAGGDAVAEQVRFDREWSELRAYAAGRGVRIIGDVPIYVAAGSCDHMTHPGIFLPGTSVAGAPPDALNARGQKWGNPLYDWDALAREGYRWWIERLRRALGLVDVLRLDHFRGFAAYWTVPTTGRDARAGRWTRGPGAAVFRAAEAELGPLPVIAEDLGVITPDVERLRDELGFPGMVVLEWAFGGSAEQSAPARESSLQPGHVDLDARHRHARRALPGRGLVASARDRALLAGRARTGAGAGCAWPRLRGTHEQAGRGRGQLVLAARARAARGRGRRSSARGCARCRPRLTAARDGARKAGDQVRSSGSFGATTRRPSRS